MGIEPSSEGMQGMAASISSPQEQQQGNPNSNGSPHYDHPSQDDFLDQMISNLASWPDMAPSAYPTTSLSNNPQRLFTMSLMSNKPENTTPSPENMPYPAPPFDDSSMLASRLRQHQISGMGGGNSPGSSRSLGLLQLNTGNLGLSPSQLLSSRALRSPTSASCMSEGGSLPLPLSLGQGNSDSPDPNLLGSRDDVEAPFKTGLEGPGGIQGLYNGFQARAAQSNSQHFQSYGGQSGGMSQPPASGSGAAGGTAPARPRVRARRGQATDPHSIAERLRRERIAERMKALQELVPNANKTDKASMLDEIIDYVKFLQLQVKVLSMSRLGGAAAVAPLVADISEAGARRNAGGDQPTASSQDSLTAAEHQVAKMMEEDMGSAMQYLQGKGLCLMPISLASAISTATCHTRNPSSSMLASNLDRPSSPSMSVLTVQSALGGNGAGGDADISRLPGKDSNSVAKP